MARIAGEQGKPPTRSLLVRWGGLAGIMAGVLFATWGYIDKDGASSYRDAAASTLSFVVPLLFLAGLVGLYVECKERVGWLGEVGFALGFAGPMLGVMLPVFFMSGVSSAAGMYAFIAEKGWSPMLFDWLSWLFSGLVLIGVNTVVVKPLGLRNALPLAVGSFGWAYQTTDLGALAEQRTAHVLFGVIFSLGWVTLGYALLRKS